MITCRQLTKVYGSNPQERALDGVGFQIDKGEFVLLRGPMGAGKTTLFRLLCGLTEPTSGVLEVGGLRLPATRRALAALRRRMGVIEQEPRLIEELSVFDNAALGLEVLGVRGAALKRRTLAALRALSLEAQAAESVRRLSAGQRQKVCVARALATEPLIVLADEPCRHLDTNGAAEVLSLLRWLNLQGSTIVAVAGECWPGAAGVLEVAARVLWLERGRLVEPPAEAQEAPCVC